MSSVNSFIWALPFSAHPWVCPALRGGVCPYKNYALFNYLLAFSNPQAGVAKTKESVVLVYGVFVRLKRKGF